MKSRLFIKSGYALWIGVITPSLLHRHYAIQFCINPDEAFEYRHTTAEAFTPLSNFAINANVPHQIRIHGKQGIFLYVDPETPVGRGLQTHCFGGNSCYAISSARFSSAVPQIRSLIETAQTCEQAQMLIDTIIGTCVASSPEPPAVDIRVMQVTELIKAHLAASPMLTVRSMAKHVHLSPDRLMHLFTEQVGLPIRRYILWQRLIHAHYIASSGESLTTAAHSAGFSDLAHMTRTFRRMLGHTPSAIFSRFVQAVRCDL